MTVPPEVVERVRALPPEGRQILLARLAARRAAKDPHGPLGTRRRKWPTPGAMALALDPTTKQTAVLDLLDAELVKVADGATRRLAFYMPPQEGKSQRVSRRFVTWLLSMDPTLRIVVVSFEKGRATRWGKWAKADVETYPALGVRLREDSRAQSQWQTLEGGGVFAVGIGGALTGEPADVIVIDDPVKDRKAAESEVIREATWEWWESVGQARLSTRGRVVLIMTDWHHDSLGNRLEVREAGLWRVVRVPAIADEEDDPLGRKVGDEMPSVQNRPPGHFHALKARVAPYVWASIYQQRPTPAGGNMFRRLDWRYWRTGPGGAVQGGQVVLGDRVAWVNDLWRFITVDLAASTKTSADYTVASVWGHAFATGDLLLLDRVRARVVEDDHATLLTPLTQRWGVDTVWIERSFITSTLIRDLTNAGLVTTPLDPDADKVTRAIPYANRVRSHTVWLPSGAEWLDEWEDEHAKFPAGAHDDQVDTGGYAVRVVGTRWNPAGVPSTAMTGTRETADPEAPGFDYEEQQW